LVQLNGRIVVGLIVAGPEHVEDRCKGLLFVVELHLRLGRDLAGLRVLGSLEVDLFDEVQGAALLRLLVVEHGVPVFNRKKVLHVAPGNLGKPTERLVGGHVPFHERPP
jgi:hypothetical protein